MLSRQKRGKWLKTMRLKMRVKLGGPSLGASGGHDSYQKPLILGV